MRDKHDEPKRLLRPLLASLGLSMLSSVVILIIGSALVSSGALQQGRMPVVAGIACLAGAFIAGARCISVMKSRALLAGIAGGFGYFMALFVLGSIFYLRWLPSSPVTFMLAMGLSGGLAAGIMGSMRKPRDPRSRP